MARARQLLLDLGVVRMNRAVLPYMRRKGSGLLLHISSGAGRIGIPGLGFYSASKFAVEASAEAYHYELARRVYRSGGGPLMATAALITFPSNC